MLAAYISFPNVGTELVAVEIGEFRLAIRWYALAYIAGILIGWRICVRAVRSPDLWSPAGPPMNSRQIEDLLTWIIVGVIVGGRLGFVLFYQPNYYFQNPLEILMIWQGGMSFHGGFAGVTIAGLVFCIRQGTSVLSSADLLALAAPPGILLGRIANFTNNELWGRATDVPWGVVFPGQAAQTCPEVVGLCARHPSQLYEALLEGIALGTLLLILAWRCGWLQHAGRITGMFLVGYGISRIIVEFFRQPDMQFVTIENPIGHALHWDGWGVTMGQLLSIPMLLIGLALIWGSIKRRNDAPRSSSPYMKR